jgi:hypothetical protein
MQYKQHRQHRQYMQCKQYSTAIQTVPRSTVVQEIWAEQEVPHYSQYYIYNKCLQFRPRKSIFDNPHLQCSRDLGNDCGQIVSKDIGSTASVCSAKEGIKSVQTDIHRSAVHPITAIKS